MLKFQIKNSIIATIIILVFIGAVFASVFVGLYFDGEKPTTKTARFVAYLTQHSFKSEEDLKNMEFDKYTHIIFSFAKVSEEEMVPMFFDEVYNEETNSYDVVEKSENTQLEMVSNYLKTNFPNIKLTVAFGKGPFCKMSKTEATRKKFAEGCKAWMEKYDLDGFDVDWEYPDIGGCNTCCKDHARLMAQLRETLGEDAVLSCAISAWPNMITHLDVSSLNKSLTFVNVMTYDYGMESHTPYDKTRNSMYFAYLSGFDKLKLNVGLPYYSRCATEGQDYWHYQDIMDAVDNKTLTLVETENESYAYNDTMHHSFDTAKLIKKKAKLVSTCGYGGVFCWNLVGDRNYELINAAYEAIGD